MSESTNTLLQTLNEIATLAVLTGRSKQDLETLLQFAPQFLIGNHGLEWEESDADLLNLARRSSKRWKAKLQESIGYVEGVTLEDKKYSLTIHYQASRMPLRRMILDACSRLTPKPRKILGKNVVNLTLPVAPNKGDALMKLLSRTQAQNVFYIGDDDTDEDVFSVGDSRLLSVRVGRTTKSSARFFIEDQSMIDEVLSQIIKLISQR